MLTIGIIRLLSSLSRPARSSKHPDLARRCPETNKPQGRGYSIVSRVPLATSARAVTNEDQVQRLAEANTMWQIRARQAEEQLKQLTAGTTDLDTEPEPNTVDAEGPQLLQESDPGPTGVLAWWKRFWRHLEGA